MIFHRKPTARKGVLHLEPKLRKMQNVWFVSKKQSMCEPCHSPVATLSQPGHNPVTTHSQPCQSPVTALSQPCDSPVTTLSPPCHSPVTALSQTCRNPVAALSQPCHPSPQRGVLAFTGLRLNTVFDGMTTTHIRYGMRKYGSIRALALLCAQAPESQSQGPMNGAGK